MTNPPFIQVLAVEVDLCTTGVEHIIGLWYANYEVPPSVLWVHPKQIAFADRILESLPIGTGKIISLPDPSYHEDWWSLGTRRDKGMGSNGT